MPGLFFYTIGIAFTSGIFLRSFFDVGYAGAALVFLMGIACLGSSRITTKDSRSSLGIAALALLSCSFGILILHYQESYQSPLGTYEGKEVVLEGVVAEEPEYRAKTVHLYIEPDIAESDECVLVTADKFLFVEGDVSYGDTVRVEGVLTQPEAFAADGGRTFDYPGYLRTKNVFYTMQYAKVSVEERASSSYASLLYAGKKAFMNAIEEAIPEPAAGLGEGVLLGVKRALGDDLERTFRETGIIHIVVLSGYNVMIVVEVFMFVLSFLFFPRTRMILGLLLIFTFALLVGFSATVLRASVMAMLLIVARTTGRTHNVLRALMLALVVMLAWNPYLLVHDPGFQLSFLATLGLILLSPLIEERLTYIPEIWGVRALVTATLSAQVAVLPILLYHMGLFSVVALVVNMLVLPMVPVAMGLTFLTGVTGLVIPAVGTVVGLCAYVSLEYIVRVAEFFGALPFASFKVAAFPFWIVVAAYLFMGVGYLYLTREKQHVEENPYEGWVIEEEKEGDTKEPPEELLRNSSGGSPLPFR